MAVSTPRRSRANGKAVYVAHGAARTLMLDRSPEVVLSGPAGTGKSRACLEKLHLCALKYAGMRALIVRKTRESLTESALVTFETKVVPSGDPLLLGPQRRMRQAYHYPNGSEVVIGGLDKPSKVMSTEYDLIYVQEAIELFENDWESLTTRLRNGVMPYQQMIADTNPDAPMHWLKRRVDARKTVMHESRHEDNPVIWDADRGEWTTAGEKYIAKLEALTGVRFNRLRHGRWVAAEGMVYEGWDRQRHMVSAIPETSRTVASVDWGFSNPGCIQVWKVDGDGRMYLVREHYQTQQLIGWWVDRAKEIKAEFAPEAFACDPAEPSFITEFRNAGMNAVGAFNDIKPGIHAVAQRLAPAGDGRPRLFVSMTALADRDERLVEAKLPTSTVEEIDGYVYAKGQDGKPLKELPVDKDNHGLDTMRYAVAYVDRLGKPAGKKIRVI